MKNFLKNAWRWVTRSDTQRRLNLLAILAWFLYLFVGALLAVGETREAFTVTWTAPVQLLCWVFLFGYAGYLLGNGGKR